MLSAGDRNIMRYSPENRHGPTSTESTVLINLSETGVAFLVDSKTDLRVHERIKVEIPIPGGDQIAWWGTVVRMEEYTSPDWGFRQDSFNDQTKFLVGVRFDLLPHQHSRSIRKGIEKTFMQIMRDQQYRTGIYYRNLAIQKVLTVTTIVLLTVAAIAFMWLITRPSANYDAKKGAPWGQRFKF